MKKILVMLMVMMALAVPVFADFSPTSVILEKADMVKLSDEKLLDSYMDVMVDLEASRAFHSTSGFSPKQYDEFRSLLKYRLLLLMEIHNRNIEIPQQMERF